MAGLPIVSTQNPYRAVGGETFGGGSSNAMNALQNPQASKMALIKARMRAQAGLGPSVTQQDLYSDTASPSFGFGSGDPRYGGGQNTQRDRRIGNLPGTMSAPSPTSPFAGDSGTGGGLSAFYGANARDAGGNRITNPYTGLPYNSSANDRLQQQAGLQASGDQQGLAALGGYNAAVASGNPAYIAGAQQNINTIRAQKGYRAGYGSQSAGGASPDMEGGTTFNPTTGQWERDVTPRAKGGKVRGVNPYMVGEKGPEEFVGKDGARQMLGMHGPEVGTFKEPGKVIPNNKLPSSMRGKNPLIHRDTGGAVIPSDTPGVGVAVRFPPHPYGTYTTQPTVTPLPRPVHRDIGGPVAATVANAFGRGANALSDYVARSRSPLATGIRSRGLNAIGAAQRTANNIFSPFVEPPVSGTIGGVNPSLNSGNLPLADDFTSTEPDWDYAPPNRIENPFLGGPWTYEAPLELSGNPEPDVHPIATPLQQNMYDRGATNLSPSPTGPQTFLTKYGKVSNAPTTDKHTIGGIDAGEWFQRAANRWGSNPYATPEKGFPAEGQEQQVANRGAAQTRLAALRK